jgi:hypothetical protein
MALMKTMSHSFTLKFRMMISLAGMVFLLCLSPCLRAQGMATGGNQVKKTGQNLGGAPQEIKQQIELGDIFDLARKKNAKKMGPQQNIFGNLLNLAPAQIPKAAAATEKVYEAPPVSPEKSISVGTNPPAVPESAPLEESSITTISSPEPAKVFVNHEVFGEILEKYVTKSGWVDYRALLRDKEDRAALHAYVEDLSALNPSVLEDRRDKFASWLNLYNAIVLDEVLNHYPVQHMMKLINFFGVQKYQIGDRKYSLIEIEEEVFQKEIIDPRTVFARVNGSSSGPKFLKEAFDPKKVDEQLDERTISFLTDQSNVRFDSKRGVLYLSAVFLWYEKELIDVNVFLSNYLNLLPKYYQVSYMGFDWKLNDSKLH